MRVPNYATDAMNWLNYVYKTNQYRQAVDKSISRSKVYSSPYMSDKDILYFMRSAKSREDDGLNSEKQVTTTSLADILEEEAVYNRCSLGILIASDTSTKPAANFLLGVRTDESKICRMSGLYNVLVALSAYRESPEQKPKVNSIYTPGVPFNVAAWGGNPLMVDVLSHRVPEMSIEQRLERLQDVYADIESVFLLPYLNACSVIIVLPDSFERAYGTRLERAFASLQRMWSGLYSKVVYVVNDKESLYRYSRR